jgi:hypothetical protein
MGTKCLLLYKPPHGGIPGTADAEQLVAALQRVCAVQQTRQPERQMEARCSRLSQAPVSIGSILGANTTAPLCVLDQQLRVLVHTRPRAARFLPPLLSRPSPSIQPPLPSIQPPPVRPFPSIQPPPIRPFPPSPPRTPQGPRPLHRPPAALPGRPLAAAAAGAGARPRLPLQPVSRPGGRVRVGQTIQSMPRVG